jgi:hypothetical protein
MRFEVRSCGGGVVSRGARILSLIRAAVYGDCERYQLWHEERVRKQNVDENRNTYPTNGF